MAIPEKASDFKKMTVLVVDDMANMRRTVKNMLRFIGFEKITEAANGEIALEKLRIRSYDLVVCDWNMPNMHGLDLLHIAREEKCLHDAVFIMITAELNEANIVAAAENAVDGYMIKPFVAKQLEEKIKKVFKTRAEPTPFELHMRGGTVLLENGSFASAREEFQKALKLKPDSARARLAIGDSYKEEKDVDSAEKWLDSAIEKNPKFTRALESMGDVLIKKGDTDGALEVMKKAGELSPYNPKRQVKLGKLYIESGDAQKADAAFKQAVEHSEHDAALHTEIGEAYLKNGEEEKAALAFNKSLGINENVHVYNRLGIALRKKQKYKEAEEVYQKAINLEPDNEVVHFNIARLYLEMKDNNKVLSSLRKALAIAPAFKEAKDLLDKIGNR